VTPLRGMDGLRAFGCLTVFLANFHHSLGMTVSGHVGPFDFRHFAESGIGVAMFLVLSGTLLSLPFWKSLDPSQPQVSVQSFAVKRIVRIVPPYYACLLVLFAWHGIGDYLDAAAYFLFFNNLRETSFYGLSPQFWTIGVFVQLYCVLPLLFGVIRRFTRVPETAVVVFTLTAVVAYLLHWGLMATRHEWVVGPVSNVLAPDGWVLSHSMLAHLPHFLIGVAGGYALLRLQAVSERNSTGVVSGCEAAFWVSAVGVFALAAVPSADRLQLPYARYWLPWMPGLLVVTIVTAPFSRFGRRLLDIAPLRWLGAISYGIYIYHVASMELVRKLLQGVVFDSPVEKLQFAAVSLSVAVIVAAASYLLLERPLLRWVARRH
jgi:peptidoglycan/LPS O-acetylase OafA/YrhL